MTPEKLAEIHALAMTVPAPWSPQSFAAALDHNGTFIVAPDQSDDVAFALGRVVLDEAELLTLAVDPRRQRQGLGRACMQKFEHMAVKHGATRAFLEVAATNQLAIALYTSQGWKVTGRRDAYYKGEAGRIDAILMSTRLGID